MAGRTLLTALLLSSQCAVEAVFFNLFRPESNPPRDVASDDINLHVIKRPVGNPTQAPHNVELPWDDTPRFGRLRVRQGGDVVTVR